MFRDRPLTWLFVVATIIVDVTMYSSPTSEYAGDLYWEWKEGFLLGQSAILGAWFAIGKWHRLARGACLVLGLVGLAYVWAPLPIGFMGITISFWGIAVTLFPVYAAICFFSVLFWNVVIARWLPNRQSLFTPIKFPLVELFGWTIVVALISFVMRDADFPGLFEEPIPIAIYLTSAIPVGLLVVLFLTPAPVTARFFILVSVIEAIYLALIFGTKTNDTLLEYYTSHLYAVCWILVQRLDFASQSTITQASVGD